jgi:hypothetical protein
VTAVLCCVQVRVQLRRCVHVRTCVGAAVCAGACRAYAKVQSIGICMRVSRHVSMEVSVQARSSICLAHMQAYMNSKRTCVEGLHEGSE